MKKILLLTLALMLTLAFAAPALADITATDGTGTTEVTYEVASRFTVTIPATVTLTNGTGTGAVSLAAGYVLPMAKTLKFAITNSVNYDTTWKVAGETNHQKYAYTIKDNTTDVAKDVPVELQAITAATDNTTAVSKELTFALADGVTIPFADTYKDTLTFTVTLDDTAP